MQTNNPFPGMNPFLEGSWPDVHTALIVNLCDALSEVLPLDLSARAEEEIDAVLERSDVEPPTERWIRICDTDSRLITVIEVLSPANKRGQGRAVYVQKQQDYLAAGVNLVEIDLLRMGRPVFLEKVISKLRQSVGAQYLVAATRAARLSQMEDYYCSFRDRLPPVRVPLRVTDSDVTLELQPLIDHVYRTGRYWQISHRDVPPPALPPADADWVQERLHQAGLC